MTELHPDYPDYMPIIKWQQWEQKALSNIDSVKDRVIPCLEIRDSKQHTTMMRSFLDVWNAMALVDYANPRGHLTSERRDQLRELLAQNFPVIPVINPSDYNALRDSSLVNSLSQSGEVALRIRVDGINIDSQQIQQVASSLKTLSPHCTIRCLIVDGGVTPKTWDNNDLKRLAVNLRGVQLNEIQAIYFASGSFPDSLANIKGTQKLPRLDWRLWCDLANAAPDLPIGYSDYGTLSPQWTEEVLKRYSQRVALRYTSNDEWIIVRGNAKTKKESIAITTLFVTLFRNEFKGPSFSYGDQLIDQRADSSVPEKSKKCGLYHITEAWAHHIAFVVKQQY